MPLFPVDGIEEAPEDGNQYARQDAGWSVVVSGGVDESAPYNWTGQHNWTEPLVFGSSPLLQVQLVGNGAMTVRNFDNSENAALRCSLVNSGAYNFWADGTLTTAFGDLKWDSDLSGLAMLTDLLSGVLPVPIFIGSRGAGHTAETNIVVADVAKLTVADAGVTLTVPLTITDGSDPFTLPGADGEANQILQTDGSGAVTWVDPPSGGSGETNTNSNEGGGAGLSMPKAGVNLPLKTLVSGDGSVIFTQNADTIDLAAVGSGGGESNTSSTPAAGAALTMAKNGIDLPFRSIQSTDTSVNIVQNADNVDLKASAASVGAPSLTDFNNHVGDTSVHFTEASIDHTAIANIGTNSHTQIDAHIGSTSNPHSVTALQVGADPAGSADAVQTNLQAHIDDTNNPHSVDAADVGADPIGSAQAVQDDLDNHTGDASIHFADALSDGKQYGRQNNVWTEIVAPTIDLTDDYAWTGNHSFSLPITVAGIESSAQIGFTSTDGDQAPTGTTATLDLTDSNHVILDLSGASGTVTTTFTPPANRSCGTVVLTQGATPRDINWQVTGGTVKWLGVIPTWDDTGEASKDRIVSWHWDSSTLRLMASSNG